MSQHKPPNEQVNYFYFIIAAFSIFSSDFVDMLYVRDQYQQNPHLHHKILRQFAEDKNEIGEVHK